jgi:hypothetical protein
MGAFAINCGLFFAKNENEWNSGLKATRGGWKKESRQNKRSFVCQSHGRNEAANIDTAAKDSTESRMRCLWRIDILAVPRMIKKLEQIEIPDLIAQSFVIKRTSPNRAKVTLPDVTSERNFAPRITPESFYAALSRQ